MIGFCSETFMSNMKFAKGQQTPSQIGREVSQVEELGPQNPTKHLVPGMELVTQGATLPPKNVQVGSALVADVMVAS